MREFSPDLLHEELLHKNKPILVYDEKNNYREWKMKVKEKLIELLGDMPKEKVALNVRIEWEKEYDNFTEKRIVFDTEPETAVPCHLWIPKNAEKPCPVIICMQGHATGMHISMGRAKFEGDENVISGGDRDFARQIVNEGYVALILEQRAFGERRSEKIDGHTTCNHPAMVALMLGRTLLGERIWDVSRAIDMLSEFDEIDINRIGCMGNSGGGTTTYYAACIDERIKIAMPSCSVCTFKSSIGAMHHCVCNYVPNLAKYMDMGDMACMIAPRKLVVVARKNDPIFPLDGTTESYNTIEKIYKMEGCPNNCRLIVGDGEHRFYAEPAWKAFNEIADWKK